MVLGLKIGALNDQPSPLLTIGFNNRRITNKTGQVCELINLLVYPIIHWSMHQVSPESWEKRDYPFLFSDPLLPKMK